MKTRLAPALNPYSGLVSGGGCAFEDLDSPSFDYVGQFEFWNLARVFHNFEIYFIAYLSSNYWNRLILEVKRGA